jgi:tetraacyldisaccharide 4'-kinase
MPRLRQTIETVIQSPAGSREGLLERVLGGLSRVYGLGWRIRAARRQDAVRLACPVVSVGNLTVGGTGKTPVTAQLAVWLRAAGRRPGVLSRGYRGAAEKHGGLVSDGERLRLTAATAGDEPWLLAHRLRPLGVPLAVGADRAAAGRRLLAACAPDVMLLDDGFQHRRLARDLDLVLLDAEAPLGNGRLLPRGPLREPPIVLHRADAFILTRSREPAREQAALRALLASLPGGDRLAERPVFTAAYRPVVYRPAVPAAAGIRTETPDGARDGDAPCTLAGLPIAAFAGLARNDWFRAGLERQGARLLAWRGFPDHHHYTPRELAAVVARARQAGAAALVTTEKDLARIPEPLALPQGLDLLVAGVRLHLPAAEALQEWMGRRLGDL